MRIRYIDGHRIKRGLLAAAQYLEHKKETINQLNVFPVPDGDTGSNMAHTVWGGINRIQHHKDHHAGNVLASFAEGALLGGRGNSGVILSQIFQGISERAQDTERLDASAFAQSLDRGCCAAYEALLEPQEGTILTVMRDACAQVLEMAAAGEQDIAAMVAAFLKQAQASLQTTPEQLDVLKQAGVVDAGGYGLVTLIEGILNITDDVAWAEDQPLIPTHDEHVWEADPLYRFCMVFRISGAGNKDLDPLKHGLSAMGGSILCARGKGFIKVHVHSNKPENVLSLANRLGHVEDLKQEDMQAQQRAFLKQKPSAGTGQKTGLVAVASGEGFAKILQSLGVHCILSGGPTMNPSVAYLLQAVNELPQDEIVIFPNDKNIRLTAEQVKRQSDKTVEIINTEHVPQSISAVLEYNPTLGATENAQAMNDAVDRVAVGAITTAMRDTTLSGLSVNRGDILSLVDDELFSTHPDAEAGVLALLNAMVGEGAEVISVYFGEAVTGDSESVKNEIASAFPEYILEFHSGGQAHYSYMVSVE